MIEKVVKREIELTYCFINKDNIGGCDNFWDYKSSGVEFFTDEVNENYPINDGMDSGITMIVESSVNHYSIQLLLRVLGD